MKKWNKKCPKCGSKNVTEHAFNEYICEEKDCGTIITVELVLIIQKIESEHIAHAVIKINDGTVLIGKSHAEIIKVAPYGTCKTGSKQGFLTSRNRFVDRFEASAIAIREKQVKQEDIRKNIGLLSENIWSDNNYDYDTIIGYCKRIKDK